MYHLPMKLRKWISEYDLPFMYLCENPNSIKIIENAIEYNLEVYSYLYPSNRICWHRLSQNPNAIHILEKYKSRIDWEGLSCNPNAFHILEQNKNKIVWYELSENPHPDAIKLLKQNYNKICWVTLSKNPNAIDIIEENYYMINWNETCITLNTNPRVMKFIEERIDKLDMTDWELLSRNPAAIDILIKYPNNIDWESLSRNPCEKAVELLRQNPDKICWTNICENPYAIDLIEENIYKIRNDSQFRNLATNPAIFTYDYEIMKQTRMKLNKELIEYFWHPLRVEKMIESGIDIDDL